MPEFSLRSSSFEDGGPIPKRHSRTGGNVSPALAWTDPPEGTAELVLVVDDPDAPSGTFTHWIVGNLSPERRSLEEGEVPGNAFEGRNDFGEDGYGGPQPPQGDRPHRYVFHLYAIGHHPALAPGATAVEAARAVETGCLGEATLVGLFAA